MLNDPIMISTMLYSFRKFGATSHVYDVMKSTQEHREAGKMPKGRMLCRNESE